MSMSKTRFSSRAQLMRAGAPRASSVEGSVARSGGAGTIHCASIFRKTT